MATLEMYLGVMVGMMGLEALGGFEQKLLDLTIGLDLNCLYLV